MRSLGRRSSRAKRILLGPQRRSPSVRDAVASLGVGGPIATITAGWEERDPEDAELVEHLGVETRNLGLWTRAEAVFERDKELLGALRRRKDRRGQLQGYYRVRLAAELDATRELCERLEAGEPEDLLEPEIEAAIESVRALDARHLERIREINDAFEEDLRPSERASTEKDRRELETLLADARTVCIAGGHVGVLLTRLQLFGVPELIDKLPIVAWSGGAMILAERVVLFHDSPPQGPGHAEVYGPGLGFVPGVVPLPNARRRLRTDDATRVSILARRFGPALCPALDVGDRAEWDGKRWTLGAGTRRLDATGELVEGVPA